MRYLIQIDTAAGQLTVGHFNTLTAARDYLAGISGGQIVPLIPAHAATAQQLATMPREKIKVILDKL